MEEEKMIRTDKVTNPADNSVIGEVEILSHDEVSEIVDKAVAAQKVWAATPLNERGECLRKLADLLEAHDQEIGEILAKDMGKPIGMGKAECADAAFLLRAHVERANHLYDNVICDNAGTVDDLRFTKREAIGVVGCIIPYNYPIELTFQKLAPALIGGNACVVKVPTRDPLAVMAVRPLIKEAGIPENVVQIFACDRDVITSAVVKNPKVAGIAMTGSSPTGAKIAENAGSTLKSLMLELGGNDPLIIFKDVDPKKAAEEIAAGRWDCNGQICCGTKRIIIAKSIKDAVINELIEVLKTWKVGDPMDPDVVVSYLVNEDAAKKVEEQVNETIAAGAKLVWGNGRTGARFEPVILDDVTDAMDIAHNMEVFGMVFPFIALDDEDEEKFEEEAVRIANDTIYGLSSGVMCQNMQTAFRVARQIEAGGVVVNGHGCNRHYDQPFGGPKMTGLGREGVMCSIEEFTQVKTYIYNNAFGK